MSFEELPEGLNEPEFEIKSSDPFEQKKQELRDNQETIHAVPDHPYVDIKIPTKNKVGDKCVIKFSKPVPKAQVAVSQDIQWKKRDKWDKQSKPELVSHAFILDEHKAKGDKLLKEVSFVWEDIGVVSQERKNLLKAGEYLVEVRVWNNEAWEETNAKRLVEVKN